MKERPIIFSSPMVQAILAGSKSQTRRTMKPIVDVLYGIQEERIQCYRSDYENIEWNPVEANPDISERRLYGRRRWEHLLANEIQRLWSEGFRGMVSVSRTPNKKGLFDCFLMPSECQGDENGSPPDLYCISRNAAIKIPPSEAFRRHTIKHESKQSPVGNPSRELARQENACQAVGQCCLQVHPRGEKSSSLGDSKRTVQPKKCSQNTKLQSVFDFLDAPYRVGVKLWVRETWTGAWHNEAVHLHYAADCSERVAGEAPTEYVLPKAAAKMGNWVTPRFMPRWASRINLEITEVRVQRLQEISEKDSIAEGIEPIQGGTHLWRNYSNRQDESDWFTEPDESFRSLWQSINGEESWASNPWVWCISFRRTDAR